ncbi:MAG: hypothetical protein J0M10_05670 [Chitinophagales bacterium]|nr:hypothetical protein [Chitinophagales bacterium]
MKRILVFIAVALFAQSGFAQQTEDIVITPGVGVNKLKLGMSIDDALAALEGTPTWHSYTDQLSAFASDGTRIDSVMQFVLGFDTCARYDNTLPANMPVFGLYFKKNKLNFITVTSYSATDEHLKAVKINNGIRFHDAMADCTEKLSKHDYLTIGYGDYSGDHYYYTLGLEMVYDEEKLTAIGIFPVTTQFKKLIAEKSKKLLDEASGYGPDSEK